MEERIQKKTYAIKNLTSTKNIKIYNELKIDKDKTKDKYEINFNSNQKAIITIVFSQISKEAHLYNNDNKIPCKINGLNLECEITKEILPIDKTNPTKYKLYELNLMDGCNNKKYTINVNVKEENENKGGDEKKDETNYIWLYMGLGIAGAIIISLAIFFIVRYLRKKNQSNLEVQLAQEMLEKNFMDEKDE